MMPQTVKETLTHGDRKRSEMSHKAKPVDVERRQCWKWQKTCQWQSQGGFELNSLTSC